MKLYRVKLRGMASSYGVSYVVADNPDHAYKRVRKYLDVRDLGFSKDRELDTIELLAETGDYPACQTQLHLPQTEIMRERHDERY